MRKFIAIFFILISSCFASRIGYINDVHHTDLADRSFQVSQSGPRFYSESAGDVGPGAGSFLAIMATEDPDCVVEGGDFVEDSDDNDPQTDLDTIEDIFDGFGGPRYHVIGNWDMADAGWADADDFFDQIENGEAGDVSTINAFPTTDGEAYFAAGSESAENISRYYAFDLPDGVIGIVLDSTGRVTGDTTIYYIHSQGLLGQGRIPTVQVTWLDDFLDNNTTVPIVVFIHHHIWPWDSAYSEDEDTSFRIVRNAETLKATLEQHGNVVAVFQGHAHPGSDPWWDDTTYAAHIDGPETTVQGANLDFFTESNGTRYYAMRSLVTGWGSGSTSTSDDDTEAQFENWGEATPANCYYLITVGRNLGDNGKYYVHVKGYGNNPGGASDSDNLLARWKLDDAAGQTTVESTNGNQDGTSANNIVRGNGAPPNLDRSMLFVALSADFVTNAEIVVSQYPFTFAGWFNTSAAGGDQTIFSVNKSSTILDYAVLRLNTSDQVEMGVKDGFAGETVKASTATFNDGQWHHAAATFASSTDRVLYVDGVSVATDATERDMDADIDNWSIGAREGSSTNDKFDGSLADIRVYDVAKTATEVREIYEDGAIVYRSRYLPSSSFGRKRKRY